MPDLYKKNERDGRLVGASGVTDSLPFKGVLSCVSDIQSGRLPRVGLLTSAALSKHDFPEIIASKPFCDSDISGISQTSAVRNSRSFDPPATPHHSKAVDNALFILG